MDVDVVKLIRAYKNGTLFKRTPEYEKMMAEEKARREEELARKRANRKPPQKLDPNLRIVAKTKAPLCSEGTYRYRNQAVILDSETVGEALERLRKLVPSPGSKKDIELAVKDDAIELVAPGDDNESGD